LFLLVVEPDTVSGTWHNLQNRAKSRFVSAGCLFVSDNTRADVEFSMSFSLFHVVPAVRFHPTPEAPERYVDDSSCSVPHLPARQD